MNKCRLNVSVMVSRKRGGRWLHVGLIGRTNIPTEKQGIEVSKWPVSIFLEQK